MGLDKAYCFDFAKQNYFISGQWSSLVTKHMNFNIFSCQYIAENPKEECGDAKLSEYYRKYLYVNIFTTTRQFAVNEFEDIPVETLMKYEYRPLNRQYKTAVIYDMEKVKIKYNNSPFGIF